MKASLCVSCTYFVVHCIMINSRNVLHSATRLSTLAVTFTLQPTKNGLLNPVRSFLSARSPCLSQRLGELHRRVELHAGSRLDKISRLLNVDGIRLATAYAECAILRIALKPLLVIQREFMRVASCHSRFCDSLLFREAPPTRALSSSERRGIAGTGQGGANMEDP